MLKQMNMPKLDLSQLHVMGILNVTPDSFSDGARFHQIDHALRRAEQMVAEGATIIDVGGESTRPGAMPVSEQEELNRVVPVIESIRRQFDVYISVDTVKASVMKESVNAGANMINDVLALQGDGALSAAAKLDVPVCLMHMQGEPRTMQNSPLYENVIKDVIGFLLERAEVCEKAGIAKHNIVLDPGFGFGKTAEHNFSLLGNVDKLVEKGYPVLIGLSRKSMFGQLLGRDVDDRLAASLAGVLTSAEQGATIFRVHDVKETVDCLSVWQTVKENKK